MVFPIYRKYPGDTAYFEIRSAEEFRELKIIGNHYELHHIRAQILPERTYIEDLINNPTGHYVESNEEEFNHALKTSEEQRIRLH